MRNKAGFTMTETLIALFILAVGTMLFCNFKTCPDLSYYQFPSRYVLKQSAAIRTGHPRITIGLGTGRLVFHEDE